MSSLCSACRYAGPEDSPTTLIDPEASAPEAGIEAGTSAGEGTEVLGDASVADARGSDPRPSVDAAAADGAAADDAMAAGDAASSERPEAATTSCEPPPDLACDPVSGEGCLPLMQCIVDPSADPAAYCVVSSIVELDVTCTQTELSTDCAPGHTCVMGECRKYCYCDADCENGAACRDPSGEGSPRFKLCEQTSAR